MRILLTAPPLPDLSDPLAREPIRVCPPLALYLLAAVAEEAGHEVQVIDPAEFEHKLGTEAGRRDSLHQTDVLGISVNSCTWPRARQLIGELERLGERPIIVVGGPHASALGEHILRTTVADYVVRGEGEKSFPALLMSLGRGELPEKVPGVLFRRRDEIISGPPPQPLSAADLAALPQPRFELMPRDYYDLLPIESSRGCLYSCLFCSTIYPRRWHGLSAESVLQRLTALSPFLSFTTRQAFFIIDDCFTADHERLKALSLRARDFPAAFVFEARVTDVVADGLMEAVSALPVLVMEMGIECGYEEGLARVGKRLHLRHVEEATALIQQSGLGPRTRYSFIMGFPWESRKEVVKTLSFAFRLTARQGARLVVSWLTVFPGSTVWHRRKEWRIEIEAEDYDRPDWWGEWEVFRRCHPGLRPDEDFKAIVHYVQFLKQLFPTIIHDGWFRRL